MKQLSIIIPVKNEENNLPKLIEKLSLTFSNKSIDYELIVVVDKSTDRTLEIAQEYSQKYPIKIHQKLGKPGKAFSILEGIELAEAENIGFIDGDLQYPPSAIPGMLDLLNQDNVGVVVANRKTYKSASVIRKLGSRINRFVFGKILLGLDCDVQSGLKLFKKEISLYLDKSLVTAWTIDMPLLTAAKELGYDIAQKDITFETRENGASHIGFLKAGYAIAKCALKIRFRTARIHEIQLEKDLAKNPTGTSIAFKGNRFTVHNSLSHEKSSILTFTRFQKSVILTTLALGFAALIWQPMPVLITITAVLSFIYFADVIFTAVITAKSLHFPPEISVSDEELNALNDNDLPIYTILCPLYKEAAVLQHYIDSMEALEWPKSKLDVLLLLEEDDHETIQAAQNMSLPDYVKITIVPHSMPKTKPKACNFGLHHAKGGYAVIYDAEDKPDPLQLKKAYLGFQKASTNTVCIQAKLNYYNSRQNLLTKLFTAEYSLWFDVILPGLQSIETLIPLGGTSNHFDLHKLRMLEGWDAFNVTEDCDLGVRLFKDGYKTAIVDSTTYEEANSNVHNWIRQRSRWLKGYLQTYFVHMRHPIAFFRKHGWHALLFQLVIGLRISFILINPILWATTIAYFTLNQYVGTFIQSLYPGIVFYMAFFALVFGNFLYLYNYMIGLAKKEQWGLIKYVFFVPFYWLLMSVAAVKAFYQLFVKPHYWEKTHHGLHLTKRAVTKNLPTRLIEKARNYTFDNPTITNAGTLIFATVAANLANFIYNAYLGRQVTLSQFGTVALVSNIFAVASVFSNALGKTIAFKTAYKLGKTNQLHKGFYLTVNRIVWAFSLATTLIWIVITPALARFFNENDITPFLLFTPYWLVSFVSSVNSGFLSGAQKFAVLGMSLMIEAVTKVTLAIILVQLELTSLIFAVIPASVIMAFLFEWWMISKIKAENYSDKSEQIFPWKFYWSAIFTRISSVIFISADVILAKHFLSPSDAGRYALVSLSGKIVYFLGTIFGQFMLPVLSKKVGENATPENTFNKIFLGSSLSAFAGFISIGILGNLTVPLLFGNNAESTLPYLTKYTLAMLVFTISGSIVVYHQVQKRYLFTVIPLLAGIVEIGLIALTTPSIGQFVDIILALAYCQLVVLAIYHQLYEKIHELIRNVLNLLTKVENTQQEPGEKLRILVFNWRDIKHVWAGGAELYVHELAKKWIENGHEVTVFCGNDRKSPTEEYIDGVQIYRKGGFFTVYFWAFFYYVTKFRNKYDVIVDSENGIPFFTPLFTKKPVTLLIHHVHKDIVLNELKLPWYFLPAAYIAKQLEDKLMPLVYKNASIVAVSPSTKEDLIKIGFDENKITIINPGVDLTTLKPGQKTQQPSVLYVGRIKQYKSIDTLIQAFHKVVAKIPEVTLKIAGFGDARKQLEQLVEELNLQHKVVFLGKVNDEHRNILLSKSWVFVYPSTMEGWGISIIEASASGTAVVASDVPGLRDSVKNPSTGLLVEKGNVDQFAHAITNLIKNTRTRKKFEKEGPKWAQNFTWEKSAQKYLNLFDKQLTTLPCKDKKLPFSFKGVFNYEKH